jgi:subtilisin family serine protease
VRRVSRTAAAALILAATAAPGARPAAAASPAASTDLCDVLDLVLPLDCEPQPSRPTGGGSTSSSSQDVAPAPEDQVRRTSTEVRYDPRRLTVTFERGVTRAEVDAVLSEAGVTLEQAVPAIRAYMVGVDPNRRDSALASLRGSAEVASAGQEVLADALDVTPNDAEWPRQWGLRVTGMPQAWSLVRGSAQTIVAVVDTGVDPSQPDIRDALVPGFDFVHQTQNAVDDEGHGTSVAGIIAARTGNGVGIAGVCASCLIMPVKVLDDQGVGDDSVIAAGIVWAVDHGAKVVNLSLGGPGTTPALDDAVAYAVRKGAVVVAAAGNSSSVSPFYPAASSGAIGVAATTEADRPYSWSSYGAWVKLAAPGCNPAPLLGGGYGSFCGTSSASPIVSGLAALSLTASPASRPAQVEQAVEKTAVPVSGFVQYGRIDAPAAISALAPPPPAPPPPAGTVVYRGTLTARSREQSYTRTIPAGQVTATLAFKGARTLSLWLIPQAPAGPAVKARGPSPLQLQRAMPAGTARFVVRGDATTTTYTLTITTR